MSGDHNFVQVEVPGSEVSSALFQEDLHEWLTRGKGTRIKFLVSRVLSGFISDELDTSHRGLHTFVSKSGYRIAFFEARLLTRLETAFSRPLFDGISMICIPCSKEDPSASCEVYLIPNLAGTVNFLDERGLGFDLDVIAGLARDYAFPWKNGDPLGPMHRFAEPDEVAPDWGRLMTLTELRNEKGWTDSLIRDFLGEPDVTRPNPYGNNFPMRLYARDRVAKVEATTEFQEAMEQRLKRRRVAQERDAKRALKAREELAIRLESLTADRLPNFATEEELLAEAIPSHNTWAMQSFADPVQPESISSKDLAGDTAPLPFVSRSGCCGDHGLGQRAEGRTPASGYCSGSLD